MDTDWDEMKPLLITTYDTTTGITQTREMTEEEYAALVASGRIPSEETAIDEAPASDDAGAPSTDAG